jgi:two-component system chemotaxis sensor kinase CheA
MVRASLVQQLQDLMQDKASASAKGGKAGKSKAADTAAEPAAKKELRVWTINAHFHEETFRNGMDPLSIARYLGGLGRVVSMQTLFDKVPPLVNLNPETCYLGFSMALETDANKSVIEGAFSFVLDDCTLDISAPETELEKMVHAIDDLPESPRVGEVLVHVGAVSSKQLDRALSQQNLSGGPSDAAKPMIGELLQEQTGVAPEVVQAALRKQQKIRENAPTEEGRYIRVQADRLDTVINLLGELVIASAGAMLKARETRQNELVETNLHMNRLIEEIRNGTLGLRMVPVGETFSRFRRVVRDTASSLGKEVNFEIVGGDAELDKSMVEKIADPLMHLVRNSLDHGLETPQERIAAGKSPAGKLVLSAQHESGAILIRIEDDGRGINREKVLQKAWANGVIEQGVVPSDNEINMLIFGAGFSTAEQVTNLSGRGVGMDVVRRNIESLRGTIKLNSQPGQGLQVDIRLPLTLAIIDGFLVGIGKSKFVLPLESVVEVIESGEQHIREDEAGRHCMELRGAVLPVVSLRTLYGVESQMPDRVSVVVVNALRGQFGIEVEVLLGQHQTVIKPLGRLFKTVRGISGSSILGSGEVALILDVNSLGDLAKDAQGAPITH